MTYRYYKRRLTFSNPSSRSQGITVEDGRVVEVLSYDGTTGEVTVLVERAEKEQPAPATDFTSESEPDKTVCGYPTDNGPCGRSVSEEGQRCWQHPA
jgi:hypothetical protein